MDRTDVLIFRSLWQGDLPEPFSMNPRRSFREISRKLGVDELTVRNRIQKLQRGGFVRGWRVFANPTLSGVSIFQILVGYQLASREKLIRWSTASQNVIALIEHFDGSAWVVCAYENSRTRSRLTRTIEGLVGAKPLAVFDIWFPKCELKPSSTDIEIISAISRGPRKPYSEVAGELGLSSRTVRRRISCLIEGKAVFIVPSLESTALEGALMVDLLVQYSGTGDQNKTNEEIVSRLDNYLVRTQVGNRAFGFFNLFVTKLSALHEIVSAVTSIRGVKDSRADVVQNSWEMLDHVYGKARPPSLSKARRLRC
jgi:DNA-binding Lrp family transcriptional regulator